MIAVKKAKSIIDKNPEKIISSLKKTRSQLYKKRAEEFEKLNTPIVLEMYAILKLLSQDKAVENSPMLLNELFEEIEDKWKNSRTPEKPIFFAIKKADFVPALTPISHLKIPITTSVLTYYWDEIQLTYDEDFYSESRELLSSFWEFKPNYIIGSLLQLLVPSDIPYPTPPFLFDFVVPSSMEIMENIFIMHHRTGREYLSKKEARKLIKKAKRDLKKLMKKTISEDEEIEDKTLNLKERKYYDDIFFSITFQDEIHFRGIPYENYLDPACLLPGFAVKLSLEIKRKNPLLVFEILRKNLLPYAPRETVENFLTAAIFEEKKFYETLKKQPMLISTEEAAINPIPVKKNEKVQWLIDTALKHQNILEETEALHQMKKEEILKVIGKTINEIKTKS